MGYIQRVNEVGHINYMFFFSLNRDEIAIHVVHCYPYLFQIEIFTKLYYIVL